MALISTPGASNANSYPDVAWANDYFANRRLPLPTAWEDIDNPEASLIMATRTLNKMLGKSVVFNKAVGYGRSYQPPYFLVGSTWTGLPATTTQALPWPRIGMFDANGFPIDPTVIPDDLKDATCELAGQLNIQDRTLDNENTISGVTEVRAGSVGVKFKNDIELKVLPDAVENLLVQSWMTIEEYVSALQAQFNVI